MTDKQPTRPRVTVKPRPGGSHVVKPGKEAKTDGADDKTKAVTGKS